MLLIVVPAGVGAGLGGGGPGAAGEELPAAGPEFDAVAGAGLAIVLFAGVELVPPHPAITTRIAPAKPTFNAKRGTERISQF